MTRVFLVITSLFLTLCCALSAGCSDRVDVDQPSIYRGDYPKAQLPTRGEFVAHPNSPEIQYYFTNRALMRRDKTNSRKRSGLYVSKDGGNTWQLTCDSFQIQHLFVHPDTGVLFAIIDYRWMKEHEDGSRRRHSANKALMSNDGSQWKDITGAPGYIADITGFMVDPDNPARVCLEVVSKRGYILQSEDDEYTSWVWYREWNWPKRKERPGWRPERQYGK